MRSRGMQGLHRIRRDATSVGHLQVLMRLQTEGPVRVSRLAHCLDVSAASATGMVDRMVERGLVERVREQDDRRVVLVRLAPEGRRLLEEIGSRGRAALTRVLQRLDDKELVHLREGLTAFVRATRDLAQEGADDAVDRDDCRPQRHPRAARATAREREGATRDPRKGARQHAPEDPD